MLCEKFDRSFFVKSLIDNRGSYLFPSASERESWNIVASGTQHRKLINDIITTAKSLLGQPWPQLTASLFSEFTKNGNRTNYQTPYFKIRNNLGVLSIAECLENEGSYIDEIINGIWTILSEPCWNVPATAIFIDGDSLPDPDRIWVDLFAGDTGMALSLVMMLLRESLEAHSPALCKTVRKYLIERIIEPVEQDPDAHFWMAGFNNWTPWCASSIIGTALYVLDDKERIADLIMQLLTPTDKFIATYGEDGGCDEGPLYWGLAGGKLLELLEILNRATGNSLAEIYNEPLIGNMAEYISKVHLSGNYFMSPADAKPQCHPRPALIYHFGENINSENLKQFALLVRSEDKIQLADRDIAGNLLLYGLEELFWIPGPARYTNFKHALDDVFNDLEILVAREEPEDGFIATFKGGHNAENHNHNDVGVFEIFYDNSPAFIDIGVGTYTKQTFSSERYNIWYLSSKGHNVPLVNGQEQVRGADKKATGVKFDTSPAISSMTQDICLTYPEESRLLSLLRKSSLNRAGRTVTIFDHAKFSSGGNKIELPLYCVPEIVITGPARAEIKVNNKVLLLDVESENNFNITVKKVNIDDPLLRENWSDSIYKLSLNFATDSDIISYRITIKEK